MPDTGARTIGVQAQHWVQGGPAPGTVGPTTEARYRRPFKPGTSTPGTMGPLPSGSGASHTGYRMAPHTGYMNFYTSYRGPSDQVQRPLTLGTGTSHPVQGPLHKYSTVSPHQAQGPPHQCRGLTHTPGTGAPTHKVLVPLTPGTGPCTVGRHSRQVHRRKRSPCWALTLKYMKAISNI